MHCSVTNSDISVPHTAKNACWTRTTLNNFCHPVNLTSENEGLNLLLTLFPARFSSELWPTVQAEDPDLCHQISSLCQSGKPLMHCVQRDLLVSKFAQILFNTITIQCTYIIIQLIDVHTKHNSHLHDICITIKKVYSQHYGENKAGPIFPRQILKLSKLKSHNLWSALGTNK